MILSRFPFPLEKGDKLRAYYQLVDLSKTFEIHLICTSEKTISEADKNQVLQFCKSVHIFKLKPLVTACAMIQAVFDNKPFQVHYFYQRWIHRRINTILKEIQPSHIYCQLIRASEYVKHFHDCSKTLDYMDALSKGMERRISNAFGPKKWLFRMESNRLERYERRIFDYFENHTIISAQDRNYIIHPKKDTITLIPNGVDHKFFESKEKEKTFTLVFTGNMGYPPNVEAAHYIRNKVLPLVQKERSEINCLISGANPHASLKNLESPDFHVGGWVEDIRDSYQQAQIFIAPMMIGTGLQNKLLEAMAMGLPCITTTLANNALMATPEKHILIADDAAAFAAQIIRLLDSPELYRKIADAGQTFVKENYQWASANQKLVELLK